MTFVSYCPIEKARHGGLCEAKIQICVFRAESTQFCGVQSRANGQGRDAKKISLEFVCNYTTALEHRVPGNLHKTNKNKICLLTNHRC